MTTFLSANGLIEIPEAFRKTDALKPGQPCDIERTGYGEYRLRMSAEPSSRRPKERLVDLLLRCPAKGFFTPAERSDTTDDLKPSLI